MSDVDVDAPSQLMVQTAPSAPVQVMRAGSAISADVLQFLSTEVGLTASRERDRRMAVIVLAPLAGVLVGGAYLLFDVAIERTVFAAAVASSLVLFAGLSWGVRNRALLDDVARDAAISRSVLSRAVRLVQRGAGPSSALRQALETSSSSSSSSSSKDSAQKESAP